MASGHCRIPRAWHTVLTQATVHQKTLSSWLRLEPWSMIWWQLRHRAATKTSEALMPAPLPCLDWLLWAGSDLGGRPHSWQDMHRHISSRRSDLT
jgi:hypothetical protein